jgi:hypothetical protein
MKISELAEGKVINLEGTITGMADTQKTPQGIPNRDCVLSDDEDQVKLVLWEEQVNRFKIGDIIIISGWCKRFPREGGDFQVSTGKFGKISLKG